MSTKHSSSFLQSQVTKEQQKRLGLGPYPGPQISAGTRSPSLGSDGVMNGGVLAEVINPLLLLNNPIIKRYIKEDHRHNTTAYGRGLTGKDIHYPHTDLWQAMAVPLMAKVDLLAGINPEELQKFRELCIIISRASNDGQKDFAQQKMTAMLRQYTDEDDQNLVPDSLMDRIDTMDTIGASSPFLWKDETKDMAMKMPIPPHTITSELMIHPSMFFIFNDPIYFSKGGIRMFTRWIHVHITEEIIQWACDGRDLNVFRDFVKSRDPEQFPESPETYQEHSYHHSDQVYYGWLKLGTEFPDQLLDPDEFVGPDHERDYYDFMANLIVKMLNFLKSNGTAVTKEELPRSERRRQERDGTSTTAPNVSVVNLRRVKHEGEYVPQGDGTGKTIEFRGSFWVTGHYKRQHYGIGNTLTKVIWIDPFMKGLGKPPLTKLYKVSR